MHPVAVTTPVTVYETLVVGFVTETVAPVVVLNPPAGLHVYVSDVPDAVSPTDTPEQVLGEFTLTVGCGLTVTITVSFEVQFAEFLTVTTYKYVTGEPVMFVSERVGLEIAELLKPVVGDQLYVKPTTEAEPICADWPVQNCTSGPAFAAGAFRTEIVEFATEVPHSFVTDKEILSVPALAKPIVGFDIAEVAGVPFAKDQL